MNREVTNLKINKGGIQFLNSVSQFIMINKICMQFKLKLQASDMLKLCLQVYRSVFRTLPNIKNRRFCKSENAT